ncbi:hypothetical protein PS906_01536 [Pseudomonas fluorescens]|nr:hypothetical protein PS906_01536 [Pseudomonas fluorescens]
MPYQKQQNLLNSPPNTDTDNNKDLLPYPPYADSENTEDLLPFPLAPLGERVGVRGLALDLNRGREE